MLSPQSRHVVSLPVHFDMGLNFNCRQQLDMLLEALREENMISHNNEELTRTLNDITSQHSILGSTTTTISATSTDVSSSGLKTTIGKTEKDKYNTKERRNSRYFVRTGDKEAIQTRANSLKRAINSVMEHSGLYDHKPRHGYARKHSLATLNISANVSDSPQSSPIPPPINIISPLPDERRGSMDEYFFSSVSLPVPKQFADAASRRSSGVPEPIREEEGNGYHIDAKIEYNYDVAYLGIETCGDNDANYVPYEVYERNLLRSKNQSKTEMQTQSILNESMPVNITTSNNSNTLQVPMIPLSELEMMERSPPSLANENVYTSDNMTIIDTDPVVMLLSVFLCPIMMTQWFIELKSNHSAIVIASFSVDSL